MSDHAAVRKTDAAIEPAPRFSNRSTRVWLLTAAVICQFMTAIEGTVIATAMPTIVSQLGDFHLFSWVFGTYFLTQAVTIPLSGRFADLFGRKPVLFFGLGLFLAGSTLCGFAPNMVFLIVCRVAQGIGAGAMLPAAQTLISDIYPPAIRARIQGYLSGIWASAAVGGPLLGAVLVSELSWRWVFWVNVPLGIAAFSIVAIMLREHNEQRRHQIDYSGAVLLTFGIGLLMFALIQAITLGLTLFLALLGIVVVLLTLLYFQERRAREPIIPLSLWRNPVVAVSTLACLTVGATTVASSAFLPAYIQGVMGYSPMIAGYAVSITSVTWMFGSAAGSKIMLRFSYRLATVIGSLIVMIGSLILIALDPDRGPLWAATGTGLVGLGMGLFQNTFFLAAQASVERDQRGMATASTLFARILGQTVGTALFGGIVNLGLADRIGGDAVNQIMDPMLRHNFAPAEFATLTLAIAEALRHVYWAAGIIVLIGFATTFGLPRGLSPTKAARDKW